MLIDGGFSDSNLLFINYMRGFAKHILYGHQLFWSMERDRLDAHFLRFGSGFMTENNVKEALASMEKINQILIQYQKTLVLDTCPVVPLEQSHPLK